jgi:hypothetical protein
LGPIFREKEWNKAPAASRPHLPTLLTVLVIPATYIVLRDDGLLGANEGIVSTASLICV